MKYLFFLAATCLSLSLTAQADDREYLDTMGIRAAWETTRGAPEMVIALLNTGVNYHLGEFRGRIAVDENGNYGYDAFTGGFDPMDRLPFGLGTQVASIVAGNQMGVAPEARILPIRVFDENGVSSVQVITKGLQYALQRGAKIIELGGGPFHYDPLLCQGFLEAQDKGVLLIFPAGNGGQELSEYPVCPGLNSAIVVASTTPDFRISAFSNYGFPAVHLAAQGENIWGIDRGGALKKNLTGTSFSTAIAAGVAALVWSAHPEYTAADVRSAMIRGSTQLDGLRGKVLSNGLLHAYGALQASPQPILEQ